MLVALDASFSPEQQPLQEALGVGAGVGVGDPRPVEPAVPQASALALATYAS